MIIKKESNLWLFVALLCGVGVSYFYFLNQSCDSILYDPDEIEYIDAGRLLFLEFKAHPTRTIGYPIFLQFLKFISSEGNYRTALFLGQVFLWLGAGFFFYKTILLEAKQRIALNFLILYFTLVGPLAVFYKEKTEILMLFLLTSCLYFFIRYLKFKNYWSLLIAFSLFCYSILVRPTCLYLSFVFLAFLLFYFYRNRQMKWIFRFATIFIFTIGLQFLLMFRTYQEVEFTKIDELTAYLYLDGYVKNYDIFRSKAKNDEAWKKEIKIRRDKLGLPRDSFPNKLLSVDWKKKNQIISKQLKTTIQNEPVNLILVIVRNIFSNSLGGSDIRYCGDSSINKLIIKYVYIFSRGQNIMFIGLFYMSILLFFWNSRKSKILLIQLPIIAIILNIIIGSGISFAQGDRFHFLMYPMIIYLCFTSYKFYKKPPLP